MGLIGCHVSISGGIEKSPARANALGCEVMQLFTSNQMQWRARPVSEESRDRFLEERRKHALEIVVSHDSYLINLGSPDPAKNQKSIQAFIAEIRRCQYLEIPYLVFHPGSHMGKGDEFGLQKIAESLDTVIESLPELKVQLLLENTAGQGSNVGHRFEHLRRIMDLSRFPDLLGICFDTCHAFAAGYDLSSPAAIEETFRAFNDIIGLEHLAVFHLNDARRPLGSRIDRHEVLGGGYLGMETFTHLIADSRFEEIPMILETPGGDENFAREIGLLKEAREKT